MDAPADFATTTDLVNYWRPLNNTQIARAGILLALASVLIRQEAKSVDSDVATGVLSSQVPKWVAMDMVKTAMLPGKYEGRSQFSRTVGPYVDSATLVNPAGTLVMTKDHAKKLGIGEATAPIFHFGDC